MGASITASLPNYHRYHYGDFGKGSTKYVVKTIYAGRLGYISAAIGANGVSDKWQGVQVIPLDDADEIHFGFSTPHDMDCSAPVYVRFLLLGTNSDDTITLTVTFDQAAVGATAADGATSLTDTIPAKATAANVADQTYWGKVAGKSTDYAYLFIKAVASAAGNADGSKVWAMQIAYRPRTK